MYKIYTRWKLKARKEMPGYSFHAWRWGPLKEWDNEKRKWVIETWISKELAISYAKRFCRGPHVKYKIKKVRW